MAWLLLYLITLVFLLISWLIMAIAGVNISHTLMMVVFERKRELGVLRSVGATRRDIRALVFAEGIAIGVTGGLLGAAFAYGGGGLVDAMSRVFFADMPFRPDSFFVFEPRVTAFGVGLAVVFALVGAFFPANHAARMDPAEVLTQS